MRSNSRNDAIPFYTETCIGYFVYFVYFVVS
jgi:hypothetical protein